MRRGPGRNRVSTVTLLEKVNTREAVVGIIGLGYVGIPLALRFSAAGFRVLGFDIEPDRIGALNSGRSPIGHVPSPAIADMLRTGFEATDDYARVQEADAIVICVPTPLTKHREP